MNKRPGGSIALKIGAASEIARFATRGFSKRVAGAVTYGKTDDGARRGRHGARFLTGALLCVGPHVLGSQPASDANSATSRLSHVGIYAGLISERTRFDEKRADALEEESGRFGILYGRWSVGYSEKSLRPGILVFSGSGPFESTRLRLQGIEVGRVLSTRRFVQPALHLTLSRGTVQRDVLTSMLVRVSSDQERVTIVEPAISAGFPMWRVARAELRAGMRFGPAASFDSPSRRVRTDGPFIGALMSVGWFGDWSRGWVWW